jgi:hypothetical protein
MTDPKDQHLIEHYRLRADALGKLLPAHQGPGAPAVPTGHTLGEMNRAGLLPGRIFDGEDV